jgi:hypothetical protein
VEPQLERVEQASVSSSRTESEPSDQGPRALYRNLGRYSRVAGLGMIVLTVVFIVLSVITQFVVFEIDSVVSFVAAFLLLFRDPRARVEAGVLDALQLSTDQAIRELSSNLPTGYRYVPAGERVTEVVLVPTSSASASRPDVGPLEGPSSLPRSLTPPGRGLAELYRREAGIATVTLDALSSSLSEVLREEFGLASSSEVGQEGDRVRVVLHHPSSVYTCLDSAPTEQGAIGCAVSSFLAVLIAAATGRSLLLEGCAHDRRADTWTVAMRLLPGPEVGA